MVGSIIPWKGKQKGGEGTQGHGISKQLEDTTRTEEGMERGTGRLGRFNLSLLRGLGGLDSRKGQSRMSALEGRVVGKGLEGTSSHPLSPAVTPTWPMEGIRGMAALKKRRAESYAHLLHPTGTLSTKRGMMSPTTTAVTPSSGIPALVPPPSSGHGNGSVSTTPVSTPVTATPPGQTSSQAPVYDPESLDHPELQLGTRRTVIALPGMMSSIVQYARPEEVKRKLNAHFEERHPAAVDRGLTLSQVRGVKSRMIRVGRALDMEISTLAFAIVYLEKLILNGFIDKANRRVISGVCLILAFKVNEGNEKLLPELMHVCICGRGKGGVS